MHRSIPALALFLLACACGSSKPLLKLDLRSDPDGAQVYLSRRGEKSVQAKAGPFRGDVKAESLEEDFRLLGTSPLSYESPLKETESDATMLGFGGRVVLEYKEGVVRFEKPGHETVERHVRFRDGEVQVHVQLPAETVDAPQP